MKENLNNITKNQQADNSNSFVEAQVMRFGGGL